MSADSDFLALLRAIANRDSEGVSGLVARSPGLVRLAAEVGASRQSSTPHFLDGV